MIFSSYIFIFCFLPITFIGYLILSKLNIQILSKLWLVLASLYFYAQGSKKLLPIFVLTILLNYIIGVVIIKLRNNKKDGLARILTIIGLIENIGLLSYFKYTNFFIENLNRIFVTDITLRNIILPLGISFFTFQLIRYLVDCYKGETKIYSIIDYLVFITFFPHLIVGPILHHKQMIEQIENKETYKFNSRNFMIGMFVFSIGCAKKILLADPLITYAQTFYNNTNSTGFFDSWAAVLAYTFAYYFDFSGYGDMAIGLGLFFNINLPVNFNSPYKARNFTEFWRRWNITLSMFLNDYIFKNIFKFGDKTGKMIFAVLVTFFVSGMWHGAGWHFIIWGLVNGLFVCMSSIMTLHNKKLPFAFAWVLAFLGVLFTRVLFDSHNMTQAFKVYANVLNFKSFNGLHAFFAQGYRFGIDNLTILLLMAVCTIITFGTKNTQEMIEDVNLNWKFAAYSAVLLTLSLFRMGTVSNFLYFQF